MNIGKKEARHLLDVLTHLRQAVEIAREVDPEVRDIRLLALERCIEIADEAFQRAGPLPFEEFSQSLQLDLFRLCQMISRDYHLVSPVVLKKAALENFPVLISKLESLEDELFQKAQLERPTP